MLCWSIDLLFCIPYNTYRKYLINSFGSYASTYKSTGHGPTQWRASFHAIDPQLLELPVEHEARRPRLVGDVQLAAAATDLAQTAFDNA